jgi:hypothetical protein
MKDKITSKNVKLMYLLIGIIMLGAVGVIGTIITDDSVSTSSLSLNNISNIKLIRSQISDNNLTPYMSGTILNELRYTKVNGTVDNTDVFTVRSDTYSPDYNNAYPYGFRNIVTRVNSYSHTDNANIYSIWHDYGGAQGANTWMYVYEHICDETKYNCSDTTSRSKYGLAIKYEVVQNGTDKEMLRLWDVNVSDEPIDKGIRFLGNFTTGIDASTKGVASYNRFIDAQNNNISNAIIDNARKLTMTSLDGNTSMFIDLNHNIPSGQAGLHILSDASGMGSRAALLWIRDAMNSSTKPLVRIQGSGTGEGIYVLNDGNGTGMLIENSGFGLPLRIYGNKTTISCSAGNSGGMFYNNQSNLMYYCNSTCWIPWGSTSCA